jgi:hypothetical protein
MAGASNCDGTLLYVTRYVLDSKGYVICLGLELGAGAFFRGDSLTVFGLLVMGDVSRDPVDDVLLLAAWEL